MGGGAYYIPYPKITFIQLNGTLQPMVSAKDVILEVLRCMTVKGGVGKVVEYGGFAPAGRALGEPKSKLSRRIALLEERLGVRLIQRSTRRFR